MPNKELALADFLRALKKESQGEVCTDDYSRVLYSTDASIYKVMPHGVFFRLQEMMCMQPSLSRPSLVSPSFPVPEAVASLVKQFQKPS